MRVAEKIAREHRASKNLTGAIVKIDGTQKEWYA